MLAAVRPDDYDFVLFLHVAGAMLLAGALVTSLVLAGAGTQARLTFRTLLWAAVPSWFLMRIGAELIVSKPAYENDEPAWLGIGYGTSELAGILIVVATVIAWLAARKGGSTSKPVAALIAFTVLLSLVAVWAMTTKPG